MCMYSVEYQKWFTKYAFRNRFKNKPKSKDIAHDTDSIKRFWGVLPTKGMKIEYILWNGSNISDFLKIKMN